MATKKKMLQAAAGNAGGEALNVEDVFSTYLYEGNGSTQTITNGIDLDGEGGLVWMKSRSSAAPSNLYDTERGAFLRLISSGTNDEYSFSPDGLTSFNSDGFNLSADTFGDNNVSGDDYVSWTFRKAPKFFDVVTYTGDGSGQRNITHSLGCNVGAIFVKRTDSTSPWRVWHNYFGSNPYLLELDTTQSINLGTDSWGFPSPDINSASFSVDNPLNLTGATYVAYLFAHNDGDGEFGPDGDADIIKCGSYTGNGTKLDINLGFEAQWVLVKRTDTGGFDWHLFDVMRGMPVGSDAKWLEPNTNASEGNNQYMSANSNGFTLPDGHPEVCASGGTYIYIAIRRGTKVPESGTEVFDVDLQGNLTDPAFSSNFPVDLGAIFRTSGGDDWYVGDRLRGSQLLRFNSTSAETPDSTIPTFDYMDGWGDNNLTAYTGWMWKRAPNFFDVVAYTGDGVAGRTVSHNLGVAPEMMWVKNRTEAYTWQVYHQSLGSNKYLALEESSAATTSSEAWNTTTPTDTEFTLGTSWYGNKSGNDFIAYLFASLDGISKVGSYTGNGTSQTIDCGFTSGARFVLIKRTDSTGDWAVFDTERGIVSGFGTEPYLALNSTAAEVNTNDAIDPHPSGFTVNETGAPNPNTSGASYIFYAIA